MAQRAARKRAENWPLIKRSDKGARESAPRKKRTRSASAAPRGGAKSSCRRPTSQGVRGAKRGSLPSRVAPQLATLVSEPPEGTEWLHEPKARLAIDCCAGSRPGTSSSSRGAATIGRIASPESRRPPASFRAAPRCSTAKLSFSTGEASPTSNASKMPSPAPIRRSSSWRSICCISMVGIYAVHRSAIARSCSELVLDGQGDVLRYSEHVEERGDVFLREVCRLLGLEGIVSQRSDDPYREKRTRSWLKVKCLQRQEFVIVGYTDPAGVSNWIRRAAAWRARIAWRHAALCR